MATRKSVRAAPRGDRRPCSQSRIASTETSSSSANSTCVRLDDRRAAMARICSGVYTRPISPAFICLIPSRRSSASGESFFSVVIIKRLFELNQFVVSLRSSLAFFAKMADSTMVYTQEYYGNAVVHVLRQNWRVRANSEWKKGVGSNAPNKR
jgi:hypothetical protein